MANIWFTSDTHFGHKRLAEEFRKGPFDPNVSAHDAWLTEMWNSRVGANDIVYHLGDFAMGSKANHNSYFYPLNGSEIHLIRGNHDGKLGAPYDVVKGFASVQDTFYFKDAGVKVWMQHYPLLEWPWANGGTVHAHGHSHGSIAASSTTRLDVGIDAVGQWAPEFAWGPVPVEVFAEAMAARAYEPVGHH